MRKKVWAYDPKKAVKNKDAKRDEGGEIYQFKISLKYSTPLIWRRIQVPADFTFWELNYAIQNAMGWFGGHLHNFSFVNKKNSRQKINIGFLSSDIEYDKDLIDETEAKITDYFDKISKQCIYEYDFGDGWEHTVVLEKIISTEPKERYPKIIAGANACPPEDCGGIGRYYDILEALKNPKHPEYEDFRDWLGLEKPDDNFDSTHFDIKEVFFGDPDEKLK